MLPPPCPYLDPDRSHLAASWAIVFLMGFLGVGVKCFGLFFGGECVGFGGLLKGVKGAEECVALKGVETSKRRMPEGVQRNTSNWGSSGSLPPPPPHTHPTHPPPPTGQRWSLLTSVRVAVRTGMRTGHTPPPRTLPQHILHPPSSIQPQLCVQFSSSVCHLCPSPSANRL